MSDINELLERLKAEADQVEKDFLALQRRRDVVRVTVASVVDDLDAKTAAPFRALTRRMEKLQWTT